MKFGLASFLVLVILCASCNTYSVPSKGHSPLQRDIVDFARSRLGDDYSYGKKGPNQFDCSGLVHYVFNQNGIKTSGSAASLFRQGRAISIKDSAPGDLVFFKRNDKIFHVSIISESSPNSLRVIHSTTSRGVIEEDVMKSRYWRPLIHKIISLKSMKK